jgi:hypothetical protein
MKTKKGAESKKRTHVLAICVEASSSMNPPDEESIPIKLGCLTSAIFMRFLMMFKENMSNKRAFVNSSRLNEGEDKSTTVVGGSVD